LVIAIRLSNARLEGKVEVVSLERGRELIAAQVVETSSYLTTFERSASPYVIVVDLNNSCRLRL
jgi:hypothetical protein